MDNTQLKTEQIQKKQERIVLVIASVFTVALFITGGLYGWYIYVREILPLLVAAGWVMHFREYWDYSRRAQYVTAVCWVEFIFFALQTEHFSTMLVAMACLIVLLSIYNQKSVLYPGLAVPLFVFLYHGFIARTISVDSPHHAVGTKEEVAASAPIVPAGDSGKTVVSKKAFYDCDGSGHGYYEITYSDGSVEYEDF